MAKTKPSIVPIINKIIGTKKQAFPGTRSTDLIVRLENFVKFLKPGVQAAIADFFQGSISDDLQYAKKGIVGGTVYQAQSRFKANTVRPRCSTVKYLQCSSMGSSHEYATPIIFIEVEKLFYAVCQKFDVMSRSFRMAVPAPKNKLLLTAYEDEIYGSFFSIVKLLDELIVIWLEDFFMQSCISTVLGIFCCHGCFAI